MERGGVLPGMEQTFVQDVYVDWPLVPGNVAAGKGPRLTWECFHRPE